MCKAVPGYAPKSWNCWKQCFPGDFSVTSFEMCSGMFEKLLGLVECLELSLRNVLQIPEYE